MRNILIFLVFLFLTGCALAQDTPHMPPSAPVQEVATNLEEAKTTTSSVNVVPVTATFTLPILLFHHVGEPPVDTSEEARTWYVSGKTFEDFLQLLQTEGYQTLFMRDVLAYVAQGVMPKKAVVISVDDGAEDFYTHAFPLLKKYNMKASVNLMTHVHGDDWLQKEQIKQLHASGLIEFNSHTKYHAYLTRISEEEARVELSESKSYLEELLEEPVEVISYPFGLVSDDIVALAKDVGYQAGLTIRSGKEQDVTDLLHLKRFIVTEDSEITHILAN